MTTSPTLRPAGQPASIPETLNRYLSASSAADVISTAAYLDGGAGLVTPDAIVALQRLRQPLKAKLENVRQSEHLRQRLDLLARFFDDACLEGHGVTSALRDTTFALLYFLKGFDRVPDTVPEVGLLDDAMIVEVVLQRHSATFRTHFLRHGRRWPLDA